MEVKNILSSRNWVSLPFSDHCAPLYEDADDLNVLTDFLHAASQDDGPAGFELRFPYPEYSDLYMSDLFVLHVLQLSEDVEAVLSQIHSMHRRNAKTAKKRGVHLESGTGQKELKEFYRLHLETRRRQGMPIQPWSFFEALRKLVLEQGLGFILLAYEDEECLAAAMFLHWGDTFTYKYGASSAKGQRLRPNSLLFREAIRWGCENGYSQMDFGRTDFENSGLREFKSRWGADETQLAYSFSAPLPESGGGKWMALAQNIIRHSPLWVSRLTGELFYRYFG
jgi:lipid II:glycine glycyltransferase (peptidoglycan interpeptide bridge formation enzyme)